MEETEYSTTKNKNILFYYFFQAIKKYEKFLLLIANADFTFLALLRFWCIDIIHSIPLS